MSSSLSASSPKFQSQLASLDTLRNLPLPQSLGQRHKPVPHPVLVDAIHAEIERRGYSVGREQLALGKKGAALFGVTDLVPTVPVVSAEGAALTIEVPDIVSTELAATGLVKHDDRGLSFGFRNSTDMSMAIKAVAGARVFVCDNLTMSGEMFAISRKNTTGLDLHEAVARGFDKFLKHASILDLQIERLQGTLLSDGEAKQVAYDVFAAGVVPVRLFDDVERFYFHPAEDQTDCAPRSLWGLHNAFTRAMQDLTPVRLFSASVALGQQFQLVG